MKKLLLIVGILALSVPAIASVDSRETVSIPYLQNYGYSDSMNEYIQHTKAMANGRNYYISNQLDHCVRYYKNKNKVVRGVVRGVRNLWAYIDPSEDECRFMDHDIKYYNDALDY